MVSALRRQDGLRDLPAQLRACGFGSAPLVHKLALAAMPEHDEMCSLTQLQVDQQHCHAQALTQLGGALHLAA